ncbi:MAG: hypothetical protein Tp1124SUR00d2C54018391_15 [Prokaryotic dsDNA virus sp.]|nr:MAG: hypothetical protein Tp1124SUR00d2C54018391_15 [Prokaryotic dsDNA virus sp.]|tara:strand:+ start:10557 stop:12317 length:1761 start_codon:yes stop_codon:yes gene_type:complete
MAANTFTQKIKVQLDGANKANKGANKVASGIKNLAKSALAAGAAYFTAQGLIAGVKSATAAFAQQELAERKLRFAAGDATDELIRQAKALQQNTRFGDEAIIAQQAYVKSLGVSTDQTKEIIEASVDLAAAMGISLESAVMNTTKTLSGMQGELGEKLPAAFKELTAEQLKAGEGIKFIREQFRGTAEEEVGTLTGSLDQMTNTLGDTAEAIGEIFSPVVTLLAQALGNAAREAQEFLSIFTETPFEKQIRVMQELGLETTHLEIANTKSKIAKLEADTAQISSSEDLQKKLKDANDKIIESEIRKGELFEQGIEPVTKIENGVTKLMASMSGLGIAVPFLNAAFEDLGSTEQQEIENLDRIIKQKEQERELTLEEIKQLEELKLLREQLLLLEERQAGLSNEKNENQEKDIKQTSKIKSAINDLVGSLTTKEKLDKNSIKSAIAIGASQKTAADAAKSASAVFITAKIQEAVAQMIAKAFGEVGFFGGLAVAAGSAVFGKNLAQSVKGIAAAEGMNEVVTEPTLILAGEEGAEYVNIEPTQNEGAGMGGATVVFQGNVLSNDFIENEAVPMIKEALRKGGDLGIS